MHCLNLLESSLDSPCNPRNPDLMLSCISVLQPGTREAASNPIVIILSVVTGVVLVFFLINYALYVFAQRNKPKKAGKRVSCVSSLLWILFRLMLLSLPLYGCLSVFRACRCPRKSDAVRCCAAMGQQHQGNDVQHNEACQSWMRAYQIVSQAESGMLTNMTNKSG